MSPDATYTLPQVGRSYTEAINRWKMYYLIWLYCVKNETYIKAPIILNRAHLYHWKTGAKVYLCCDGLSRHRLVIGKAGAFVMSMLCRESIQDCLEWLTSGRGRYSIDSDRSNRRKNVRNAFTTDVTFVHIGMPWLSLRVQAPVKMTEMVMDRSRSWAARKSYPLSFRLRPHPLMQVIIVKYLAALRFASSREPRVATCAVVSAATSPRAHSEFWSSEFESLVDLRWI